MLKYFPLLCERRVTWFDVYHLSIAAGLGLATGVAAFVALGKLVDYLWGLFAYA